MDEIYHHALKLLRRRDYTISQLRLKLADRFGDVPESTIDALRQKGFLNDQRFAQRFVDSRSNWHPGLVRDHLLAAGVAAEIVNRSISGNDWLSLRAVLRARMDDWKLGAPISQRDAARLFRALARLGFPEDDIREELEQLHEQ